MTKQNKAFIFFEFSSRSCGYFLKKHRSTIHRICCVCIQPSFLVFAFNPPFLFFFPSFGANSCVPVHQKLTDLEFWLRGACVHACVRACMSGCMSGKQLSASDSDVTFVRCQMPFDYSQKKEPCASRRRGHPRCCHARRPAKTWCHKNIVFAIIFSAGVHRRWKLRHGSPAAKPGAVACLFQILRFEIVVGE